MQDIHGINNYLESATDNSLRKLSTYLKPLHALYSYNQSTDVATEAVYEGIVKGLNVTAKSVPTGTVELSNGVAIIKCGSYQLVFELNEVAGYLDIAVPNLGTVNMRYIIALKVDLTNATAAFAVYQGAVSTDPTLTEGGSPTVYYLPIATIIDAGGATVTNAEINQLILNDNITTSASGSSEYVGRPVGISSTRYRILNRAKLGRSSNWSWPNATGVQGVIQFDTEIPLVGANFEYYTSGSEKRIRILKAGHYHVNTRVIQRNTSGDQTVTFLILKKNTTEVGADYKYGLDGANSFNNSLTVSRKFYCHVGDYFSVEMRVDFTAGAVTVGGTAEYESFISVIEQE